MVENYEKDTMTDNDVCIRLAVIRDQQLKVLYQKTKSLKMKGWLAGLISVFDDVLTLYKKP